mgnify:CR=1 FL=1
MTDVLNQIPTLSLADQARDPDGFAQAIGNSFRTFGFAVVADHGIDAGLIDRAWDLTRQFFALPEEVKRAYVVPGGGGQRGPQISLTALNASANYVTIGREGSVSFEAESSSVGFDDAMALEQLDLHVDRHPIQGRGRHPCCLVNFGVCQIGR